MVERSRAADTLFTIFAAFAVAAATAGFILVGSTVARLTSHGASERPASTVR